MSVFCEILANVRFQRWLIVLTVFLLPLSYLIYEAVLNPDIDFLVPSVTASWVTHPIRKIAPAVEFKTKFIISKIPFSLQLKVRAFNKQRVIVNGRFIAPEKDAFNWKKTRKIEIAPHLKSGTNELRIQVENDGAIPALLVEDPKFLRTPDEWTASLNPMADPFRPVVTGGERQTRPSLLSYATGITIVWLLFLFLIFAVAVIRWKKLAEKPDESSRSYPKWLQVSVPLLIFCFNLVLNVKLASHFGVDERLARVQYIKKVAQTWVAPLASDGWEMFQPPLYYYIGAIVYRIFGSDASALKAVQFISCLSSAGLALLAFLYCRVFFRENIRAQWLAMAFAAFLPMNIYITPRINEDTFAGFVIATAIYGFVRWGKEELSFKQAALLGIGVGAAMLTKFSALVVMLGGLMFLGIRAFSHCRKKDWALVGVYLLSVFLVCGWFYGRNVAFFGKPFVGNWDPVSGFRHGQSPRSRTPEYYLQLGTIFFRHPLDSGESWPDRIYGSMWGDVHRILLRSSSHEYFWVSIVFILAAFPVLAIVVGFFRTGTSAVRNPSFNPDLFLLIVPVWMWAALILFSLKIPASSSVKAFYFISLIPALGLFLIRGRELLAVSFPVGRKLLDAILILLCVLNIWIYGGLPNTREQGPEPEIEALTLDSIAIQDFAVSTEGHVWPYHSPRL
jgi:Dolichyl-phosphate-mannose-protein mannosyltransferase